MTIHTLFTPAASPPLLAPPGVYRPQHDTRLLARALQREDMKPGTRVLELGTGSGALALAAASRGARVTAVDISRRAVLTARLNAMIARTHVTVRRGDLTAAVAGESYDLVISNPPYVPSPDARPPRRGAARAWDAGHDGRMLVDRICDAVPGVLRPAGVLLVVHSGLCGVDATLDRLTGAGLAAVVVDRATVPFGPVLRSRLPWLRRTGLLRDEAEEELVVIRAEHA
ncbi:HemK2/MTQ2 family protein methyltransferase [Streptomyces mangrovisoli]|uniref:Methyltransferase n=1 Tax=Streptomyces mangrovisoli TaxID=1428628 RepID=A0A1J4P2C8_9ACTN|nr:HemK2/MTQ2 family protein methyltransferase [Streptomyces mangrovisoli]OIJ68354.1 methyltransferase [Streptomyces mangrovisoli]